jgi:NitT/TauT family transport system substrate-binding protein
MIRIWRLLSSILLAATIPVAHGETKIRVGHFPNVTHVQALVAHAMSRRGDGWFEKRVGAAVKIECFVYIADPRASEVILVNSIYLTYIGPSPAINAYAKSRGEEIRVLSGAVNGGAALVVQPDGNFRSPNDFRGKRIATPQLGNTQDVACRAWLASGGLKITQLGGDAQVLPTQNPDQITLFKQKKVDAVWTVEPWVSRLELESGGKILVDERDAVTTVLVSSAKFLATQRDLARKFVEAHRALTDWVQQNAAEAQRLVATELMEETKAKMSDQLIANAWKRIVLTNEIKRDALEKFVINVKTSGFFRDVPDLGRLLATEPTAP